MRASGGSEGRIRAFWLQRSRAQAGVLTATALTVLVVTLLASTMVGLAVRSPTVAVRQSIQAGPAVSIAQAEQGALAGAATEQDATVRSIIRKHFTGAAVTVDRSAFVPSVPLAGNRSMLALAGDDSLRQRARLDAGAWPAGEKQLAVDAELAKTLGVRTGSTITTSSDSDNGNEAAADRLTFTVTGVWHATTPAAPAWLGLTPGAGGTDGRAILTADGLAALSTSASVQWVVAPDARNSTASQLPRLQSGFRTVTDALTESPTASSSPFSVQGDALATVTAMQQSVGALAAVIPVPLSVLAVCSVVALILLAQLLARSRLAESRVLRARGATVGELVAAGSVEAAVVGVAGVAVGFLAAQAVLLAVVGAPAGGVAGVLDLALPPLLVLAVAVACCAVVTAFSARAASGAPGAVEAGRARATASVGVGVLAFAAAGLTLWRFVAFGAPVSADGQVDPIGVIAPAAVLCAIAVLGLLLFGPSAAAVEGVASRGRGLSGVLPARQVGRGLTLFAAPVALVVLTVGAATFSAGYVGTWSGFLRDSSRLVTGADVRVDTGLAGVVRGPDDLPDVDALAGIPSVSSASPGLITDAGLGQRTVTLVALDAQRLPQLTRVGGYMLDTEYVAEKLTHAARLGGQELPSGTKTLTAATAATASVTFWLVDARGELAPFVAHPVAGSSGRFSADVPAGSRWTLAAVDARPAGDTSSAPRIRSVAAGSATLDIASWTAATGVTTADGLVRLMPPAAGQLPVVITASAAQQDALSVGDAVDLDAAWVSARGTIAAVVAAVPGTSDPTAVLVDQRALSDAALRAQPAPPRLGMVWLATDQPDTVAAAAQRAAGTDAVVTDASGDFVSRFMASAVVSLWLGTAGCALLALVAIGATIAALLRGRRAEVAVLRAVGMSSRQQARSRRVELAGIVVAAAVFGLVGGVAVFLLAGNTLARLSVVTAPATLSVRGAVDLPSLLVALVLLAAAVGAVLWAYGRAVRRQVLDTSYREETR
ncbi:FtsX-like permease family protein [Leifsonia sp. Root227]|uniref:FtsX-like permease family protein n=1 Tax=Leifsonia sp. Root227 TaxID=1736496 RepID=UPI0012F8BE5E|nr:FtsX-like permease family protein [Leifsonia sp. Root227]